MSFRLLFAGLFSVLFLFPACRNEFETVEVEENGYIAERYQRRKKDAAREGLYQKFYPDGSVHIEATYSNDTLTGLRKLYFENGQVQIEENYVAGNYSGIYKEYFEDGKLRQEMTYVDNALNGEIKTYYPTGQLKEIAVMEDNLENGPFVEYYPNGSLKYKGTFEGGDFEQGPLEAYNEEGTLIRRMDCVKGRCSTTWVLEGYEKVYPQ